ncbi:MAG: hypothetical protein ACD_26C00062G0002 [uncultured bacterium]|nr:MAG: hypothetical protein ACD_26C00062G0002 [uncultured bacterium]
MNKKISYNKLFSRNVGIFSKKQLKKIKKISVAIAGAGGLGGPVVYNLARLGVRKIAIADPEKFDASNINRQFGAYVDTIGQYKVDAIKNEILRINPYMDVKVWRSKIDQSNIDNFLDGADVVVDGIDFFNLKDAVLLYREAKKRKLWVFTCQGANNIISFTNFNPNGIQFEELVSTKEELDLKKAILSMFPVLPDGSSMKTINTIIKRTKKKGEFHIPSYVVLAPIGGALVTEELIKVCIMGTRPTVEAPDLYFIDIKSMAITFFRDGKISHK